MPVDPAGYGMTGLSEVGEVVLPDALLLENVHVQHKCAYLLLEASGLLVLDTVLATAILLPQGATVPGWATPTTLTPWFLVSLWGKAQE